MELVDRYLRTVKRYLPARERDDIVAELSANVAAAIEERERELGRPLEDAECEALLNALGHPMAVAERYRTDRPSFTFGRELIGPALFPFYVRVLAVNLLVACVVAAIASVYDIPTWMGVPNITAHVVLQFAIVTIVFASIQSYVERHPREWNVAGRDNEAEGGRTGARNVARFESISALVVLVVSNVWLVELLRAKNLFVAERGGTLVLTHAWLQIVVPYAILVAAEIVRNAVNFVRPAMVRFRALTIAFESGVCLIAIAILLRAGPLVAASNPADAHQIDLARGVDRALFANLIVAAAIALVLIGLQVRKLARSRRSAPIVGTLALFGGAFLVVVSPANSGTTIPAAPLTGNGLCSTAVAPSAIREDAPQWNGWGADVSQSRFAPAAMARLDAARVPNLKVRWAFGFPSVTRASGQPTVFGGRVFVGSENGHVYALDARRGCIFWDVDAGAPVRTAVTIGRIAGRSTAFFGDQRANAHAIDATTGEPIWKVRVDEHPAAILTGSPTLASGKLFVPVSSREEAMAADPAYPCCTFRGSVVALDAATGEVVWKTYTIAHEAQRAGKNSRGIQQWAPSGAAVWSSPAIDVERRAVYVATGDSYSDTAASTSDALIAFDTDSGRMLWSQQMTQNDAENVACGLPPPFEANCPKSNGPDADFGASPMLVSLTDGKRVLIAGQKSGKVYAVDPDRLGAPLWQTRVGAGSKLGGVQWGSAVNSGVVYVAVSDVKFGPVVAGTAGAQMTAFGVPFALDPSAGGGLVALDVRTGSVRWRTPHPGCNDRPGCSPAQSAAVTAIPGIVFSGGLDGHLRAYAMADGSIVWDVDTERDYATMNGVHATGGSIDGPGATVADGMLYVDSGYAFLGTAPGNVLLAFSVDGM